MIFMLERIKKTNDVKKLNLDEKNILAKEIRDLIIDTTSKNGGHLASNLGVVDLTIALESVFDLNKDSIVWDVGHQCYTHKILNGRKSSFKTLRKYEGISGFPKICESKTDVFNTGHSSTSISAALGIAKARDIKHEDKYVIAVIGDGALTGGMALEALNHAGDTKTKMIIVLNDNEMSISKNVGGMNNLLIKLRTKKKYRSYNNHIRDAIMKIPFIGNAIVEFVGYIKNVIKQMIIPGMYFEEIGLRYIGPVDGHDIGKLEEVFNKIKDLDGTTIVHVLTKKGKGYKYAEETPEEYHGVSAFDIETGEPLKEKKKDYSAVFGEKLVSMARTNKKIVAITAAMPSGTGLNKFKLYYPDRFFDVGIAEQHALTFAAGLAREGLVPFISIYSSFYQRGYDQVIHDIACQNLPVIMCVDRAGVVGNDGETHQGVFDMAMFRVIPNLVIMAPKDFKELESMMELAVSLKRPVVIRYPRGGETISFDEAKLELGKAEVLTKGNDLTIISIGSFVGEAYKIVGKLNEKNISAELINARFLKPIDEKTILKSIKKTRKVVVMEDGIIVGGLSTNIKELIVDNNIDVEFINSYAYPDEFIIHGSIDELKHKYKIDNDKIYKDIVKRVKK